LTLVFAAKDPRYNNAVVLQEYLRRQLADAGKGSKPGKKASSPAEEEEGEVVIVDDEEEEEAEEAPAQKKSAKKRKLAS
jgi:hypothetical protein